MDAIRISGGEPFLRSDLAEIINIIDRTASPNLIHITSNGFLTDKIIADVLKIKSRKNCTSKFPLTVLKKGMIRSEGLQALIKTP